MKEKAKQASCLLNLDKAMARGWRARRKGRDLAANPYCNKALRAAWIKGWDSAA